MYCDNLSAFYMIFVADLIFWDVFLFAVGATVVLANINHAWIWNRKGNYNADENAIKYVILLEPRGLLGKKK